MKKLHISVELQSPIALPKYPIHLDALLFEAIKDNSDMDFASITCILDTILAKEDGVYKASAMRFVKSNHFPLKTFEWALATRTHWEDWQFSQHEKSKNIITKGGGFRKRVTTYNVILTKYVDFHATGNIAQIKYLLEALGFIGRLNNQGFGEIANIQIEEIEADYSFFDEQGDLARCLPVSLVNDEQKNKNIQVKNSITPPYQHSERVLSILPSFRLKHSN